MEWWPSLANKRRLSAWEGNYTTAKGKPVRNALVGLCGLFCWLLVVPLHLVIYGAVNEAVDALAHRLGVLL